MLECNGLCLDVNGGSAANGTNIQVWGSNGSNAQNWKFIAVPGKKTVADGDYHIVSALNNNMGIDVYGNSSAEGTNVQLYKNTIDPKQVFTVKYLGDGYYQLRHKSSNKVLDMTGNSSAPFTNVSIYGYNNTDAQKWTIKSVGNGYFTIIGKGSGLAMDVYNGEAKNGANISGYVTNNTNAQKWGFVHAHSLVKVPYNGSTAEKAGNIEYWTCSSCGKYFKDSAGKKEISKADTVIPKLTSSKASISPASLSVKVDLPAVKISKPKSAKKVALVKWKKVSKKNQRKMAKIQIQYSRDKRFKKGVKKKLVSAKKTSYKITGLKSKKKYYIRLRAYTKTGTTKHVSKWSTVKVVKVK